jgi:hypothetical protein
MKTVPLFTATATAAASNTNKENLYRRRSSSLKEGSPLKAPLPKSSGSKRARVSASLKEEDDVELIARAEKKKSDRAVEGSRGRRMSGAESAAVVTGRCQWSSMYGLGFAVLGWKSNASMYLHLGPYYYLPKPTTTTYYGLVCIYLWPLCRQCNKQGQQQQEQAAEFMIITDIWFRKKSLREHRQSGVVLKIILIKCDFTIRKGQALDFNKKFALPRGN